MTSKTMIAASPLAALLPDAPFREHHAGIVRAPAVEVWEALHRLRWSDLRVGRPLMTLRGLHAPVATASVFDTFTTRAGAVCIERPPKSAVLAMVGRPWSPVPQHADVATLDDFRVFTEPGWLRYGMDWVLHDLGDGRTLVETSTLCDPTDARARRAFTAYWMLIRVGSSAIRLDMIAALRRLTEPGPVGPKDAVAHPQSRQG